MNVSYADINASDAAAMLGVTAQAVREWCRKGLIDYIDVAEGASNRPRYLIPDDEVQRVMNLMKKYGKFNWTKYNVKPSKILKATVENEQTTKELKDEISRAFGLPKEVLSKEDNMEFTEEQLIGVRVQKNDDEQILLTVAKIREFKEEENDILGRLKQVQGEIELLEKELKDLIWKE